MCLSFLAEVWTHYWVQLVVFYHWMVSSAQYSTKLLKQHSREIFFFFKLKNPNLCQREFPYLLLCWFRNCLPCLWTDQWAQDCYRVLQVRQAPGYDHVLLSGQLRQRWCISGARVHCLELCEAHLGSALRNLNNLLTYSFKFVSSTETFLLG